MTAGGGSYLYDGDGNRVMKTISGGATTLYWPVAGGVLDESNAAGTSFGRQVSVAGVQVWSEDTSGNGYFLFQDQLGSTRVTADAAGTVHDDIDNYPFGDNYANYGSSPSTVHYLFTSDEKDTESSTNYAVFRNLSGSMGRFNRADPYDGSYDAMNPQSLNRYSYVFNNPLRFTDILGLEPCGGPGGDSPLAVHGGPSRHEDEDPIPDPCPPGSPTNTATVTVLPPIVPPPYDPNTSITVTTVPPPGTTVFGPSFFGPIPVIPRNPTSPIPPKAPSNPQQSNTRTMCTKWGCRQVPNDEPVIPHPCSVLAVASIPLAATGLPEVAGFLELSAGTAKALAWLGFAGSVAGLGCM